MDDNQLVAKIFKYCVAGFIAMIITGLGSCQATRFQVRAAIEAGASPMSAKCAIESQVTLAPCAILAAAEAEANRP